MVRCHDGAHGLHRWLYAGKSLFLILSLLPMNTTVSIPGIHCPSCAALIKDVSSEFPAIKQIDVDVNTKKVTLDHDENFDMQQWTTEIEALDEKYKVQSAS